jgi:hypothetical protein
MQNHHLEVLVHRQNLIQGDPLFGNGLAKEHGQVAVQRQVERHLEMIVLREKSKKLVETRRKQFPKLTVFR